MENDQSNSRYQSERQRRQALVTAIKQRDSKDAAKLLADELPIVGGQVLLELNPGHASAILDQLGESFGARVLASVPAEYARQWARNREYPEGAVGRMLDPVIASFLPQITVGEAIERLRGMIKTTFVTYGYVTDEGGKLLGIITMRDLLFSPHDKRLTEVMAPDPFHLEC